MSQQRLWVNFSLRERNPLPVRPDMCFRAEMNRVETRGACSWGGGGVVSDGRGVSCPLKGEKEPAVTAGHSGQRGQDCGGAEGLR